MKSHAHVCIVPRNFHAIKPGPLMPHCNIIAHERTHATQLYRFGWIVFWLGYFLIRKFRYAMEIEAYAVQAIYRDNITKPGFRNKRVNWYAQNS